MNEAIKNMLNWVLVWLGVILGTNIIVNFFMQGFWFKYLKVKGSRGKKLIVQVESIIDRYLAIGYISEGFLIYKKRNSKDPVRISVTQGDVYRYLGVAWINVDEEKNAICRADYSVVEGHDAEKTETLYKRALYKPSLEDGKLKAIFIIVLLLGILMLVSIMFQYQIYKKIKGLSTI